MHFLLRWRLLVAGIFGQGGSGLIGDRVAPTKLKPESLPHAEVGKRPDCTPACSFSHRRLRSAMGRFDRNPEGEKSAACPWLILCPEIRPPAPPPPPRGPLGD